MASMKVSLQPVTYPDVETLAQIAASSFANDKHTQIKQLGQNQFDMLAVMRSDITRNLGIESRTYRKAVNLDTGEILGSCGWGFRVPDNSVVPRSDPGPSPEAIQVSNKGDNKQHESEENREPDSIDRLGALEDADFNYWMEKLMPPNTACMYILGMSVTPSATGKGVGRELLKWGTDTADRLGLFTWVHSSESAWKFYAKHGFEVISELNIDMDEWAPKPPPEGEGDKWGHYVIRWMKRPAKQV